MMKKYILMLLFATTFSFAQAQCPESFHDFWALDIHGDTLDMSDFAGKKVLVVNTASYCGYTHQYGQLQTLYNTYGGPSHPYNFEIIGFPANNFANQEPYDEDSIQDVCDSYGVTFTMMSKISVKAPGQHEIYQWLTQQSRNCVQNAPVTWNFQKFLINPDGTWHATVTPATSPLHSSIVNWITSMASDGTPLQENLTDFEAFFAAGTQQIVINNSTSKPSILELTLMNITGRHIETIYRGMTGETFSTSYASDHLSPGLYIIKAQSEGHAVYKKIVVF